jgi:hypothetical protein
MLKLFANNYGWDHSKYLSFYMRDFAIHLLYINIITKQLLDIGDRKVTTGAVVNEMHKIIDRCLHNHWFARCSHWPDISQYTQTVYKSWMSGRKSNLSTKNLIVNELNLKIQHLLPGDLVSFKSIDTVCDAIEQCWE